MLQKGHEVRATSRQLQTRYRLLCRQFQAVRQCYLLIDCACCHTRMRWQRKTTASPEQTRQSICPRCGVTQGGRELGTLALLITVLTMDAPQALPPAQTTSIAGKSTNWPSSRE